MFLSDLKFNEAYARANLGETTTAISLFYESYKYGLIGKFFFVFFLLGNKIKYWNL